MDYQPKESAVATDEGVEGNVSQSSITRIGDVSTESGDHGGHTGSKDEESPVALEKGATSTQIIHPSTPKSGKSY